MGETSKHLQDGVEILHLIEINQLVKKGEKSGDFGRYEIEMLLDKGFALALIKEMVNKGYELTCANATNFEKQLRGKPYEEITKYPLIITDEDYRKAGYR
jgi:hypothetical protein